ncbi:urease accessory protein UreF [Radicibacter daui]|uniref:urease accessory protein UreF n=1 Tax=Radicibacter daui TaxID=3064829 RepID=UPI004046E149
MSMITDTIITIMTMTMTMTKIMANTTITGMATGMNTDAAALYRLMAWLSPSYPVGAFSYSHGLEAAIDAGEVRSAGDVARWIATVLEVGGGWTDAVLFCAAWRAVEDPAGLEEVAELAAAFRATSETALETSQQGAAFVKVTGDAWPDERLAAFVAARAGEPVAYPVAVAVAMAGRMPLEAALHAYLHAFAANLVSAAVRTVPLGQTDGQRAIALLEPAVARAASRALTADPSRLGTAAPLAELHSIHHETQYTRLFRS